MTIKEVIDYMSEMKGVVSSKTMEKVRKILSLASAYSYMGAKFNFKVEKDLDTEVTQLLLDLSNEILIESETRAKKTIEDKDNENAVLAYIYRDINGASAIERVDSHSSHLKVLLEGYFAVCFARGLSSSSILGSTLRFLTNPYTYPDVAKAFLKPEEYNSAFIRSRGIHFGKGIANNPIDGLTLVGSYMIDEAFQYSTMLGFINDGNIIGYKVHRGSTYDCAICDELCVGVHQLDEMVLPAHPRCCCYMTPVYREQ